ncbi:MAG: methyl-accepting chemotaxis protein [Spirochaetaceae bacterium]|jgi:methyl-accepting chemotaxis protein|nr:methyl-accepting chemotaxis protein [Spirochaetaceae bacterium]
MKIGKKLMLMIISLNLAGTGILVGNILSTAKNEISSLITRAITNLANENANEVRNWFGKYLSMTQSLAQFMETYKDIDPAMRRPLFNLLIRTMAEKNPEASAVATCWEPNALDGMDALYANTAGTDETGRFIPYWNNTAKGLSLTNLEYYETPGVGDYYLIAKNTGHESLIDPIWYTIEGQKRLLASVTYPIKDNGRFAGAMMIDIDVSVIQDMVQKIDPYEGSVAAVFSHGGIVSGHYDPSRLGKPMSETEKDTAGPYLKELEEAIRTGKEYIFANTIPGLGKMLFFCVPLTIGQTQTPWSLLIGIPFHIINAPIYHMLLSSSIIGGIMILLIIAGAFLMARSISRPLTRMVTVLKTVGEGDLTTHLDIKSKDEIGTMTASFNITIDNIRSLILTIKDKAASLSRIGTTLSTNMTETAAAINEITANIKNLKTQAAKQSSGVNESGIAMQKIITNINELNNEIDKQAVSVSQSSSAIEEVLANIQSVTHTLIDNSTNVKNLSDASEIGRSGLQAVAADIQEIAHESEGLLEINGVMENIASQTNLLSMNAAIEAAHAGEAGRGFAVVADEIRKLAESSGEQSKTISAVLKKIKDSIDKITSSTGAVLNKFEAIDTEIKVVSQQEENIRNAMEEQGAGSKQILQAVGQMNEITGQVKRGSQEMLTGGREVMETSQTLEAITQELTNGMIEMAIGADQINASVIQVNEISENNKKDIDDLITEVNKFKIS